MSPAVITLLILLGSVILFITEIIPVAATALSVTLLLYLTKVIDVTTAFSGFTNNIVILITGMFVIGAALFETGVASRIGSIITKFAKTEKRLLLVIMTIGASLSAFLSNTSTTAVLMPIVILIADTAGFSRGKLLMPLAYSTAFGGMITLIGTNGNLAVLSFMQEAGMETFGFFEYAKIGIPLTILGTIYMLTIGHKLVPDRTSILENAVEIPTNPTELEQKGNPIKQIIAVSILIGTVIFMVFEKQFGVPLHVVSIIGALLILITRTMTEKQVYRSLDMSTIILVAGMLPMASALAKTGAAQMIADAVLNQLGSGVGPYALTAAVFLITTILTTFMSNTAAAVLLAPIGIVIATNMGIDPRAILMTICVGASAAYASPIGTPPNTMIYGSGNFRFLDYVKVGGPLIVIQLILCVALVPLFWPFY